MKNCFDQHETTRTDNRGTDRNTRDDDFEGKNKKGQEQQRTRSTRRDNENNRSITTT